MFFTKGFQLKIFIIGCVIVLISADNCQTNPCKNGSCKLQSDNQYKCQCYYGWKGSNCDENIDDCQKNPCKNGGQCIDQKNGRFICSCTSQFVGDKCQHINPCLKENPCNNEGSCEPTEDGKFQCRCKRNFIGTLCENKTTKCADSNSVSREMCSNHGICEINQNGALSCKCDSDYSGQYCNEKSPLEIGCKENYCLNDGICRILENGSPTCECKKGYTGKQCSKEEREDSINSKTPKKLKVNMNSSKLTNSPVICDSNCLDLKGNGACDQHCNTLLCGYDGGDCDPWRKCNGFGFEHCRNVFNNGICNPECNSVDCLFDGDDCLRSACQFHQKCSKVYQNQICNEECNNPQCGFDGGDCQTDRYNSFFSKESLSSCSGQRNVFELDLILITSLKNFTKYKSEFLQKLSSTLRMVVTVSNVTEISFNHTTALLIKLYVNHTQCILYGGQCFSSLEQISNFLKAGIEKGNVLSLPFRLAKVDTRIIRSESPNREIPLFTLIIGAMVFGLIITFILVGVLLRDKWGKLRSKIKTAGVWTPSDGYSTSTSSINSGHKLGWPKLPQLKDFKNDYHIHNKFIYDNNRKIDQVRHFPDDNESERVNVINNRKRKYETINRNDKALAFQLISDCLESNDGVHPIDSGFADIYSMISGKNRMKFDEKFQNSSFDGLGEYVNENGESLLHIAARMNCGPNIIKQLNAISPSMLQSLDEWGRTPLASSIAADAAESSEQLMILEKQLRKESKNKSRLGINGTNTGTCEYLIKKTTALIEAVKLDSKEMINILLDEGNPVNVLDSQGRSVVHWAAMLNNHELLERLSHMKIFQKLADLKDNEDKSPLFLAANDGALESVKFLLGYFNKLSIKIDLNCPCPKMIAEEKGFFEIRDIIQENLRKVSLVDKNEKKLKLKELKTRNKNNNFEIPSNLCIIDEYKELSANSIENFPNTPMGNESIDSCLLELCSITDPSIQNTQELYSNEKNLYSSFKPMDYNQYHGYQSNTSSSDMSPPLLNLNNQQFQNGFNPMTQSDPLDSNFSNSFFMSPKSFMGLSDTVNVSNKNKALDFPTDYYNYQTSPTLSEYKHSSAQLPNFPPVNCLSNFEI